MGDLLVPPVAVVLDVPSGGSEHHRVVLELPEAPVAGEAQQLAHPAGPVVVVDVCRGCRPADGAPPTLGDQHRVGLLGRDAVAAAQVIGPRTADLVPGDLAPRVVAREAVGGPTGTGCRRARELLEELHGVAVGTPLVPVGHDEVGRRMAVPTRLDPTGFAAASGAFGEVCPAVEGEAIA